MQVLNVDGMKVGNTKFILPVTNLVPRQYYCYIYGMLYISRSYLFDCYTLSCVAMCFYWTKLFSSVQLNINYVAESCAVEPMYYVNIGTVHKCPDYQVVLVILFSLHAKALFVTVTKCVYVVYVGLLIFKRPH